MRIKNVLISISAILALSLAATPALASTVDDLKSADEAFSTATSQLLSDFDAVSTEDDVNNLDQSLSSFQSAATKAKADFSKISNEASSDGWSDIADDMNKAVDSMLTSAEGLKNSIKSKDQEAYYNNASSFQAGINEYQSAIDKANTYAADNPLDSGDSQYALWFGLLALSLVCLVGAIVMTVMTRKQNGVTNVNNKSTSLKELRRNVLIGAGIFVVGAAIPAAQYWYGTHNRNADGTFTYYIFYWPLIIGAFLFIAGLFQYLMTYIKLKKSGDLGNSLNPQVPIMKVPEIGSKIDKK